jgi:8-oxo-dGTP diphosphatase
MGMSDYIRGLREKIGTDLILGPGVAAIVVDARGHVLLQLRSDTKTWGLPGGAIDPGEEPAEAVVREVFEETGVTVEPERIVGVYGGREYMFSYPNGDQIAVVSITFACRPLSGEPCVNDDECLEVRYFAPDALPELRELDRERIELTLRGEERAYFKK